MLTAALLTVVKVWEQHEAQRQSSPGHSKVTTPRLARPENQLGLSMLSSGEGNTDRFLITEVSCLSLGIRIQTNSNDNMLHPG